MNSKEQCTVGYTEYTYNNTYENVVDSKMQNVVDSIGLETKWLPILSLSSNDKILNHLVANSI